MTAAAVVRDVFRQARATGLTATLLAFSAGAAVICYTAEYAPAAGGSTGTLTLLFGRVQVLAGTTLAEGVRYLQFLLAGIVADTLGILIALVWTAGFLPAFLDPGNASVLIAKPPSRIALFLARFFGVVLFVGVQGLAFIAATAVALGLRTGIWPAAYWFCVPLLLIQFTVFYAFSAVLAVSTRSTAGCLIGSILFWLVCWTMNYGRHALVGLEPSQVTAGLVHAAGLAYWVLPKPADFGLILYDPLGAERFTTPMVEFGRVQERGMFQPFWSVVSSLAFAAVMLAVAVYEFVHDDY
jgi:hypothetical protein